jgi:hypothetical protein
MIEEGAFRTILKFSAPFINHVLIGRYKQIAMLELLGKNKNTICFL